MHAEAAETADAVARQFQANAPIIDALVQRLKRSRRRSSSPARAAAPTTPRPMANTCSKPRSGW